jgi:hypothetical protein
MRLLLVCSLLFAGMSAHAAQTADCAANLVQLKDVIRSKFNRFNADYANRFVGTWSGPFSFAVSTAESFNIKGMPFQVCPQNDGSFFIFLSGDTSNSGFIRISGRTARVYGASGMVSAAAGTYRKTSELADAH